ncbi:MAG TPA: VTT domain-containing protein [Candidatus Nanoarchaeia archaeon]|nr:VTT domain-containing protein [Candidatus Nanoarchaeia archaeon]
MDKRGFIEWLLADEDKAIDAADRLIIKYHNLLFIIASIVLAVYILKSPSVIKLIEGSYNLGYLGIFIVGLFFSYAITTPVAVAMLAIMGAIFNPWLVAFIGAFGSLLSDFLLFVFMRKRVMKEISRVAGIKAVKTFKKTRTFSVLNKLAPLIAGLIIASPLPDELAVALFGYSKIKRQSFLILSYFFNFLGILVIAMIGRGL